MNNVLKMFEAATPFAVIKYRNCLLFSDGRQVLESRRGGGETTEVKKLRFLLDPPVWKARSLLLES